MNKQLSIVILSKVNPWFSSSASSNRLLGLVNGLIRRRQKITILIYGPYQNNQEKTIWDVEGKYDDIDFKYINPSIIRGYVKIRFYNYIGQNLMYFKNVYKAITQCINFDVIWFDYTMVSLKLVKKFKLNFPDKILFMEQNEYLDIHNYNKGNIFQRWEGNRRKFFFENDVFHNLDGLALMTQTLLNHYQTFKSTKPNMIHLPMTVDIDRFNHFISSPQEFCKPYIVFVGVMNDAKDGVGNLIKAFNLIKDQFLEHKVYLVGAWNYDTPIHLELIKTFGLEDRVFWMKEYSRDAIPSIIGNADLLALPRPDSKQAQGGFPTKLGEYLATGKPVCATSVGELPDYLTDNESVFFAQPGSVDSFADAMRQALSDPENAKRVGINGKQVAQKEFNKDIQAKKLHQFLLELQDEKYD